MAEITEISGTDSGSNMSKGVPSGLVSKTKIQEEADKIKARRELPKPPGNVIKFKELVDWLGLLTDEMYERLMIYVYRYDPVINRQFVDPTADNNIDVISGQGCRGLSEDYFIDRHAGGTYGLTIKDTDVVKKGDRGYFEARLSINQTQYPPKLDYREVDWLNPKNKGYFAWARAQRIVDNNGVVIDPSKKDVGTTSNGAGTTTSQDSAVAVMKATMDMVGKLNEQQQRDFKRTLGGEDAVNKPMTELLIAKMKEDSPNNIMPLLTTLLPLLMKQPTPVPVQDNGGLTAIATMMTTMMTAMMKSSSDTMTMMNESNKNTMTLLTTMLANQSKGGDDSGDMIERVIKMAQVIKGHPPAETTTTEKLIDKGMELALPIMNIIGNVTAIKAGQNAGNGVGQIQQPNSMQNVIRQGTLPGGGNVNLNPAGHPPIGGISTPNQLVQNPQNSKTLTEDFGGITPNVNTPAPGVSSTQSSPDHALINTVQQYGSFIMNALNAGKEGWEFGESVADMFGDIVVQTVAKHGTDNLIRGMKLVPEFWTVIENSYGEAHMKKWVNEFINYKKIIAGMDAEGDIEEIEEIDSNQININDKGVN